MSADSLIASADTIRKPADTIRIFLALLIVLEIKSVRGLIFSFGEWIVSRRIVRKVGKGSGFSCVFLRQYTSFCYFHFAIYGIVFTFGPSNISQTNSKNVILWQKRKPPA